MCQISYFILIIFNYNLFVNLFVNIAAANETSADLPIILGWNNFFGEGNVIRTIAPLEQTEKCLKQCRYSQDKTDYKKASAIVFHAYNFGGPLPEQRTPNQLYALFNLESPYVTNSNGFPSPDFFNLTMSYRAADATNLHAPYGGLHRVDWSKQEDVKDMWTEKEILERVAKKKKSALQIVSNCVAISGRQFYTDELAKHMNITKYGKCFHAHCDNDCYKREMEEHFFYLAFENSVCRHYVTEKFWNTLRHLTVPVVLSRAALRGLNIPDDTFIAADDFGSPKEMAKFLVELQNDRQRYLSYFNWTQQYRRTSDIDPPTRAICGICELAHQKLAPGSKIVPDFAKYWHQDAQCQDNFGKSLLEPNFVEKLRKTIKENKIFPEKIASTKSNKIPFGEERHKMHSDLELYSAWFILSLGFLLLITFFLLLKLIRRVLAYIFLFSAQKSYLHLKNQWISIA